MKTVCMFFAARRYWADEEKLRSAYETLAAQMGEGIECCLAADAMEEDKLPQGDCLIAVPMSGAVQQNILAAAAAYESVVLYGAYIRGTAPGALCSEMLRCNAAPTLMDTWAVLRRTTPGTQLALNEAQLKDALQVLAAYNAVRGATLLQIGHTEPWVISNASEPAVYEARFGVKIRFVEQDELAQLYRGAQREQAQTYYDWFVQNSTGCAEPTDGALWDASRMAWALITLLERYGAQGAAIACFNLLSEGTTSCLGVSYVNDCTPMVAACEGDMDSAVTMLMMKHLTSTKLWMANPGLQPDGTVNFSHCTAPICCMGDPLPCTLRSHHESGIGVSLQVELPQKKRVTACRISDEASKMTVHLGYSAAGPYETACRTQMHVRFDDAPHYLRTVLGCHQVFAFEDVEEKLLRLAALFGLDVL